jgi:hypothetical protein
MEVGGDGSKASMRGCYAMAVSFSLIKTFILFLYQLSHCALVIVLVAVDGESLIFNFNYTLLARDVRTAYTTTYYYTV